MEYKTKVLFLNRSKAGRHVFIFNDEEKTLGGEVESLLMNLGEVAELVAGDRRWVKVSVMTGKDEAKNGEKLGGEAETDTKGGK